MEATWCQHQVVSRPWCLLLGAQAVWFSLGPVEWCPPLAAMLIIWWTLWLMEQAPWSPHRAVWATWYPPLDIRATYLVIWFPPLEALVPISPLWISRDWMVCAWAKNGHVSSSLGMPVGSQMIPTPGLSTSHATGVSPAASAGLGLPNVNAVTAAQLQQQQQFGTGTNNHLYGGMNGQLGAGGLTGGVQQQQQRKPASSLGVVNGGMNNGLVLSNGQHIMNGTTNLHSSSGYINASQYSSLQLQQQQQQRVTQHQQQQQQRPQQIRIQRMSPPTNFVNDFPIACRGFCHHLVVLSHGSRYYFVFLFSTFTCFWVI